MRKSTIEKAVATRRGRIAEIDQELIGDTIGVAEALDKLRKALDKIDDCIDRRDYERASEIGYRAVTYNFVFLQRCLGGLQDTFLNKCKIVSDIAYEVRRPYEKVLPHVDALMTSAVPLVQKREPAT